MGIENYAEFEGGDCTMYSPTSCFVSSPIHCPRFFFVVLSQFPVIKIRQIKHDWTKNNHEPDESEGKAEKKKKKHEKTEKNWRVWRTHRVYW